MIIIKPVWTQKWDQIIGLDQEYNNVVLKIKTQICPWLKINEKYYSFNRTRFLLVDSKSRE